MGKKKKRDEERWEKEEENISKFILKTHRSNFVHLWHFMQENY
jgi:hypothetical protein